MLLINTAQQLTFKGTLHLFLNFKCGNTAEQNELLCSKTVVGFFKVVKTCDKCV